MKELMEHFPNEQEVYETDDAITLTTESSMLDAYLVRHQMNVIMENKQE